MFPSALEPVAQSLLQIATGPAALVVVVVYSFLVAFVLPFPGEFVLATPLDLGLSPTVELVVLILVSSAGKALGSLAALEVGQGVTRVGMLDRLRGRLGAAPGNLATRLTGVTERYGYVGLAAVLAIPFAPDTAVVYAFSVVGRSRVRFALATFVGTALRLAVVAGLASVVLALL